MPDNTISISSTPLSINGQPLGGGFSFAYDLGGSTTDYANQAYAFMNQNNAQNQAFLGGSISGTQQFLSSQLTPLTSAIAATQTANANLLPVMTQGISNSSQYLTNSMSALVAQGYQTIQNNVFNTNQGSTQVANSGGGMSYICTAMFDANLITPEQYETLNAFKDVYMVSTPELKRFRLDYYKRAPILVSKMRESECYLETLTGLKRCFVEPVLYLLSKKLEHDAFLKYKEMMFVIIALTNEKEVA